MQPVTLFRVHGNLGLLDQTVEEHMQTVGEHMQTVGEHMQTVGDHMQSVGEHMQTVVGRCPHEHIMHALICASPSST